MMRMNKKNEIEFSSPKLGAKKISRSGTTHPIIIQK
jgi:hypothetical protein